MICETSCGETAADRRAVRACSRSVRNAAASASCLAACSSACRRDLLDELEIVLVVAARPFRAEQGQRAERAAASAERCDDRGARTEAAVEVALLLASGRVADEAVRDLAVEL
jgi:hypothetical protein